KNLAAGRGGTKTTRCTTQNCADDGVLTKQHRRVANYSSDFSMLTAHELLGFMSPELSADILEFSHHSEKELYKATLAAVAQTRKVRPAYLERQPRAERHVAMVATLSRPSMELAAGALLRGWLLKKHTALLKDFLDALGVPHKDVVVE